MLKPSLITDCGRMQTTKGCAGSGRWGRRGWEGPGDPPMDPSLAGRGPWTEVPSTQGRLARGSRPSHVGSQRAWHQQWTWPARCGGGSWRRCAHHPQGRGVCNRTKEKTREFAPWRHSWCDDPFSGEPGGPSGSFRQEAERTGENVSHTSPAAGASGNGILAPAHRDSPLNDCPIRRQ